MTKFPIELRYEIRLNRFLSFFFITIDWLIDFNFNIFVTYLIINMHWNFKFDILDMLISIRFNEHGTLNHNQTLEFNK
jgi:hypothetical protein